MAKSTAARAFFRWYVRRRLGQNFASVQLRGADELRRELRAGPVILVMNHVAYWDGLLLILLEEFLEADAYCLVDRVNLEKFKFFAWLGALPLDRATRLGAYRDLKEAVRVLDAPGKVLMIFPQGEQRPAHLPLEFAPGVAWAARHSQATLVPMAIRYDYLEEPKPDVHLSIGAAAYKGLASNQLTRSLQEAVSAELGRIDRALLGDRDGFVPLVAASLAPPSWGTRLLSRLAGGAP